jgi:hypothetical protein
MKSRTIEAGEALAAVLAQENDALARLDLPKATSLYPRKALAAAVFSEAQQQETDSITTALDKEQRRLAEALAERLRALAEENKRLLERAITVQAHVLGTIGRAIAQAAPRTQTSRYGASGTAAGPRRQPPVVLSARA